MLFTQELPFVVVELIEASMKFLHQPFHRSEVEGRQLRFDLHAQRWQVEIDEDSHLLGVTRASQQDRQRLGCFFANRTAILVGYEVGDDQLRDFLDVIEEERAEGSSDLLDYLDCHDFVLENACVHLNLFCAFQPLQSELHFLDV